jgi:hypothetical protein
MKDVYIGITVALLLTVVAIWGRSLPKYGTVPRIEILVAMGLSAYCALGIAVLFWR